MEICFEKYGKEKIKSLHAQYLWEITRGDREVVQFILDKMQPILTCENLLLTCFHLIEHCSDFIDIVHKKIENLSDESINLLSNLLGGYWMGRIENKDVLEQLLSSGLISERTDLDSVVISFKNWVFESSIRFNANIMGFESGIYRNYKELIPPATCINREAYLVICDIENILRNTVILREDILDPKKIHPLEGLMVGRTNKITLADGTKKETNKIYELALEWQKKVKNNNNVSAHAALVSYIQTGDLIDLFNHLVRYNDPIAKKLNLIRTNIVALKDIRDSVAHSQVITEDCYDFLVLVKKNLLRMLDINSK
jgi:hypothetical protein